MADMITLKDRKTKEPVYPRTHIDAVIDDTNTPLGTIIQMRDEEVDGKLTELAREVIYDVSANNDGVTFASLSALLSDENLSTLIPSSVRCGGMTIRFVQNSDNKYLQYRLMKNQFSITVSDWQGVEDEAKIDSQNLVTGKGVNQSIFDSEFYGDGINYKLYQGQTSNSGVINFNAERVTTGVVPLPEKLPFILMIKGNYNVDLKYGTSKTSLTGITNVILGSDVFGYYEVTSDAIGNATYIAINIKRNAGVTPDDADIIGLRIVSKASLREEIKAKFAEIATALGGKQNTLTFDNEPTLNSNNPAKSGGIVNKLFAVGQILKTDSFAGQTLNLLQGLTIKSGDKFYYRITGSWTRVMITYNNSNNNRIVDSSTTTIASGVWYEAIAPADITILGGWISEGTAYYEVKNGICEQEEGQSIVFPMSQKATTDLVNTEKTRAKGVEGTLVDKTQNLTSSSLIIPNALSQDDWEVGSINSSTGATTDVSTSIRTKNYLPAFKMTFVPQSGVVLRSIVFYYDANWNYLGYHNYMTTTQINNESASYPTAKWYKVRIYNNNDETPITDLSDFFTNVISVTAYTHDYLQYKEIARNSANVLAGKKWVACGDSFTHGDFSGASEDNYHIKDGIYEGKLKVYPYIIGNRNNMVVVNEALNGSHMGYVADRQNLSFSYQRYMNIPSDADYITLKFGINDDINHQNIPIGTIDDTTNTTFYGAWNVVMEYIIEHHPNAKIGIIVTNGSTIEIAEATIAIAHKYGISYLNEATGEQCSYIYRSNRTDVAQSIKNLRTSQWKVSAENGHPNADAHEFESTVVENWLRSL